MNTMKKTVAVMAISLAAISIADAAIAATTTMSSSASANTNPAVVSTQVMSVSNGVPGPSGVSMLVMNAGSGTPKVKINLNSPAMLTVYDQNGNVAFTQKLQSGITTVDTTNFPLGNDTLVVTVNQTGSTFTMKQSVMVTAPTMSGS